MTPGPVSFCHANRNEQISQAAESEFDLLVIGGGITGAGILLDACLRGLKVLLLEKKDFGWGTSSRSTKLIHGGLRYLKQLELKLVRDVGRERAIVHQNAPHLVIPERMLLPIVKGGSLGAASSSAALYVYDLLAGVERPERRKMLDKKQTAEQEPLLNNSLLLGGGLYYEYRTDDARLVISLVRSALAHGGAAFNYMPVLEFEKDAEGKITAVSCNDELSGKSYKFRAKAFVNATGPWVDDVRKADQSLQGKRLKLSKGVHLVFPYEQIPLHQAAYFDVGDGRMIFAIPRGRTTYVGTTDTFYEGPADHPVADHIDAVYLCEALRRMFPGLSVTPEDAESSWCGLRPLIYEEGKSATELSRKDEIFFSSSGLISIAGGKLTGFRLMAEKVIDQVVKRTGLRASPCVTRRFSLVGAGWKGSMQDEISRQLQIGLSIGVSENQILEWFYRYGSEAQEILELCRENTGHALIAELEFSYRRECVCHPADFMVRRSGMLYFNRPALLRDWNTIVDFFADKLNYSPAQRQQAEALCRQLSDEAIAFRRHSMVE